MESRETREEERSFRPFASRQHYETTDPEPMGRMVCGDLIGTRCAGFHSVAKGKRERTRIYHAMGETDETV